MKYRKKPVVIEAYQFDGTDKGFENIPWHCDESRKIEFVGYDEEPNVLEVHTLEGVMTANKGDWLIKGIKGEIYPCKPDIFEATYEKVE